MSDLDTFVSKLEAKLLTWINTLDPSVREDIGERHAYERTLKYLRENHVVGADEEG